jgi:hypothetical protein
MALVDKKLTELTEILSVPDNAFIHVVDPNDVSQSPQGSSYKAKKSTIGGAVKAQVTVSGTVKTNVNNADPIVYLKGSVDALLSDKQDTLVNGINIASINSQNLLNGGNIEIANTIPTLQEVLDNNNDLIDGKNFQGTEAGLDNLGTNINALGIFSSKGNIGTYVNSLGFASAQDNTGNQVNALGSQSAKSNSGVDVNAMGTNSAKNNTGNNINALGNSSADGNTGSNVNALGFLAAAFNTFNNVNLFGAFASADENGQTVFGKTSAIFARLSTLLLTATRKYILPDESGTIALESYVDAIPNPTLNVLPKKGASGFVDSLIFDNGTNVGINQLTPTEKLDVIGNGKFSGLITASNGTLLAGTGTTNKIAKFTASGAVGNSIITDSGTDVTVESNVFTQMIVKGNESTRSAELLILNNLNRGISLNVTGSSYASGLVNDARISPVGSASKTISIGLSRGTATPTLLANVSTNNVGINQSTPTEALDVLGSIKISALLKLGQFTTGTEPAYVKGASFFNTTLNKMRIGGATAYETVTSL